MFVYTHTQTDRQTDGHTHTHTHTCSLSLSHADLHHKLSRCVGEGSNKWLVSSSSYDITNNWRVSSSSYDITIHIHPPHVASYSYDMYPPPHMKCVLLLIWHVGMWERDQTRKRPSRRLPRRPWTATHSQKSSSSYRTCILLLIEVLNGNTFSKVLVNKHVSSSSYDMYPPPHMKCILLLTDINQLSRKLGGSAKKVCVRVSVSLSLSLSPSLSICVSRVREEWYAEKVCVSV